MSLSVIDSPLKNKLNNQNNDWLIKGKRPTVVSNLNIDWHIIHRGVDPRTSTVDVHDGQSNQSKA